MVDLIFRWTLIFGSIFAFANAAGKCSRSPYGIKCENADTGVIQRLAIYYRNDTGLTVTNSSVPILETGMFADLKFVEKLSLSRCGIRKIEDGVFRGLNLTHLNLSRNSIGDIPENVFADLRELKFLDLSHNAILRLKLNAEVGYSPELIYVDVSNNRLEDLILVGNFTELETINFENNTLGQFRSDDILRFPKIKEVFFEGNSFNKSYESFLTFVLTSSNIKINFENNLIDDGWSKKNISTNASTVASKRSAPSSIKYEIEKEFKLSPELIRSLNSSQLTNLAERILILRNFTLNERRMLELERKRIRDESKTIKSESSRIEQILKRFKEITGLANEETVDDYIEKRCGSMPDDTWWRSFKKWKCKKLFNWVKRLISG